MTFSNTGVLSINGDTGTVTNVARTNVDNQFTVGQNIDGFMSASGSVYSYDSGVDRTISLNSSTDKITFRDEGPENEISLYAGGNFNNQVIAFPSSTTTLAGLAVTQTFSGTNTFGALTNFSSGISAAGGVTFSGTLKGVTASFTGLLSASAGISASGATFSGDIAVNGGDITTTSATATLYNTTATTVNIGNAASTVNLMGATASTRTGIGSMCYVKTGQTTTTSTAKQEIFRYTSGSIISVDTPFADLIITANRTIISSAPVNQITKMLVVTSLDATINHTEYGNVNTSGNLAVYTAEISTPNVIIYATPTSTDPTAFNVYATLIKGVYGFNFEE